LDCTRIPAQTNPFSALSAPSAPSTVCASSPLSCISPPFLPPLPPLPLSYSRTILISYLDDDLLIARNKFGAPEVLKRKEYAIAEGFGVPSVLDDGAPGA